MSNQLFVLEKIFLINEAASLLRRNICLCLKEKYLLAYTGAAVLIFLIIVSGAYAENFCICNKKKVANDMDRMLKNLSLDEPVSIVLKQNAERLGLLGSEIKKIALNILTKQGIACVEENQDALNRILEEIDKQGNGMFDPDSSVTIGHWASAQYLGFIELEKKISEQQVSFTFNVINLETRVHTFIETMDFCAENCSQKRILDNLPEPSPGGQDTLSNYEKR